MEIDLEARQKDLDKIAESIGAVINEDEVVAIPEVPVVEEEVKVDEPVEIKEENVEVIPTLSLIDQIKALPGYTPITIHIEDFFPK